MPKEKDERQQPDCGDDTKRDQVLKRLLGTPPRPHEVARPKVEKRAGRKPKREK